ncbi:glycosyltransferase family 4 protein [Rhodocyclus purpureus]|uniref:glycosyltransferase family 4 protein n=1 Tax=Rhodocyclus purpureus TaxID=1067 RepID=UPI001A914142|nr:glycosyltransferase family 4 protein [Rhodocyclus purpureus]MBK5913167.1 hypothetical protein [Rhodocyclus purpureus]
MSIRLAIIRQRYNPFGGAERFVERALEALGTQEAVETTLITRQWAANASVGSGSFRELRCDPFYLGSTWRDRSFAREACRLVAEEGFDLVQSHEKVACCDIYRAGDGVHRVWLAQRRKQQGAAGRLWLDLNPYNRYVLAAEEALFRSPRLKAVICISRMVRDEIKANFGIDDARLHVIYNGIDLDRFNPRLQQHRQEVRSHYGIDAAAPLFIFVGSGFERKGLAALLRNLPPAAWLLVVGKDRRQSHYEDMAKSLGIGARVRFAGPQKDVGKLYGAADAFVFPTIYEPFGNVVLEAMATGLPVLTTTTCGGAELVVDGRNGYVCDAFDDAGLANGMRALCDLERLAAMRPVARQTAEAFSLEAMATKMIDLYRSLLPRQRQTA